MAEPSSNELSDLGLTAASVDNDPYHSTCNQRGYQSVCDPLFFGQIDMLALRRDVRHGPGLLWDGDSQIYGAGSLDQKFSYGPRVTLGMRILPRTTLEATWFDQKAWDDSEQFFRTNGSLYTPFGANGFPINGVEPTDRIQVGAWSYMNNFELNVRHWLPQSNPNIRTSVFLGPRYIQFVDKINYALGVSPYDFGVNAWNDIFGGQLGGSMEFATGWNCWINVQGAGGIAGNPYDVEQWNTDISNRRNGNTTTYFGDLEVSFVWRFRPSAAITVGYKAIWLENIAAAAPNIGNDWNGFSAAMLPINDRTNAVFHGPHAGFEMKY